MGGPAWPPESETMVMIRAVRLRLPSNRRLVEVTEEEEDPTEEEDPPKPMFILPPSRCPGFYRNTTFLGERASGLSKVTASTRDIGAVSAVVHAPIHPGGSGDLLKVLALRFGGNKARIFLDLASHSANVSKHPGTSLSPNPAYSSLSPL